MARFMKRVGLGTLGLLLGTCGPRLAAQAWGVSASDPVGIARSGTGVAFGGSLEAASLNPAILSSLRDKSSAFIGLGQDLQITQSTLQSTQVVQEGHDRNRFLPSFGAAWKAGEKWTLGLKLDEPFMRHTELPLLATSRFIGQAFDLKTNRLEMQAALALNPNWSLGVSLGATRISYAWTNMVRVGVPRDPSQAVSGSNPSLGLMEFGITQEASKTVPSYSVGFRWAINPRWTVGGTYTGRISTTLGLKPGISNMPASYFDNRGFGDAITGTSAFGPGVLAQGTVQAGSGRIVLPASAALGVRQRVSKLFTWEADLRYLQASATAVPDAPTFIGKSGSVQGPAMSGSFKNGYSANLMGELEITARWTARLGASQASNMREDPYVNPMLGGARTFTMSGGVGFKALGGELNLGYQFRQNLDVDVKDLDVAWSQSNVHSTGTATRVEGMGHLWSIGFKKAF